MRLRYVCDECGDSFPAARGYREHAEREHSEQYPKASSTRKWVSVE